MTFITWNIHFKMSPCFSGVQRLIFGAEQHGFVFSINDNRLFIHTCSVSHDTWIVFVLKFHHSIRRFKDPVHCRYVNGFSNFKSCSNASLVSDWLCYINTQLILNLKSSMCSVLLWIIGHIGNVWNCTSRIYFSFSQPLANYPNYFVFLSCSPILHT